MGMAQAVEVEAGQADPLEEGWEPARRRIGVHWFPVGLAENEVVILVSGAIHESEFVLLAALLAQDVGNLVGDVDSATALFVLRRLKEEPFLRGVGQSLPHRKGKTLRIYIFPAQAEEFAAPEAGPDGYKEEGIVRRGFCFAQHHVYLAGLQYPDRILYVLLIIKSLGRPGQLNSVGGVYENELLPDGAIECLVDDPVVVDNAGG